jgi:hypothetical protein
MTRSQFIGLLSGVACVAGGALANPASANDSSAELSVGGLVFKQNADVAMLSEDLAISAQTVSVRYRFLNQSSAPVTLTVAFPLPDIDLNDGDDIAFPTSDPVNFVGFQTKIDGKPAPFQMVQQAFVGDKDVSATIRAAGLPLLPLGGLRERIQALAPEARDRLIGDGLLVQIGSDERGRPLYGGSWIVKTSAVRQQEFPPQRQVLVEHKYRTSLGMSFDTVLRKAVRESKGMEKEFQRYRTDFCVDDGLLKGVDRIAGDAPENVAKLREQRISYILKTGANWAGPIKDFRLVIDKGKADRLTSFCADNVKKISPTLFEVRAKDFTPTTNLKILIISKGP